MGTTEPDELTLIARAELKERIRRCNHERTKYIGHGYATCLDCGALLPDEDPDLRRKCL